jgi:hypothetical protein
MISILIPVHNYSIVNLVKTLLNQISKIDVDYEIICLDDASSNIHITTENTEIQNLPNCFYLKNESNLGRTQTRTLLAKKAKYDWLLFLDSDIIPVSEKFISNYISFFNTDNDVVFGGYQYYDFHTDKDTMLRWKFGKKRESQLAEERNEKPYLFLFSGNILIRKDIFLSITFPEKNYYGMDMFFSYNLLKMNAKLAHIDNQIYHLGLENNIVFFRKSLEAVENRVHYLAHLEDAVNINSFLKYYSKLKQYKLLSIVGFGFKVTEPILKHFILSKNPSLFCFDLYRLGYICHKTS